MDTKTQGIVPASFAIIKNAVESAVTGRGMTMSQIGVNQLTFYYDGSYDSIFENVSFQIEYGLETWFGREKWKRKNNLFKSSFREI